MKRFTGLLFTAALLSAAVPAFADNWRIIVTGQGGNRATYPVLFATFTHVRKGSPTGPVTLRLNETIKNQATFRRGQAFKSILLERVGTIAGKPQILASATYEAPTVTKSRSETIGGQKALVVVIQPTSIKPS